MTAVRNASAAEGKRYRVGVITSHVIQNQDPLFRRLAEESAVDVEVLFCSRKGLEAYHDRDLGVTLSWDIDMLHGYQSRFLRNFPLSDRGFLHLVNPQVVTAIAKARYDALIVMGWGSVTTWMAFAVSRLFNVPFFLAGDSSFVNDAPTFRGRVRRRILEGLFSKASGFLVMGAMNGDFYRSYGADDTRFFHVPYAIDNDRFRVAAHITAGERSELRSKFGIARDKIVLLFSGKLRALKNPSHLLLALERMKQRDRAAVAFMGDGVERPMLENLTRELGLQDVHFLGFVNQSEIPRLYAMSDVLVLPSERDHRGTVVNEAMACGLPIVISDRVGVWGPGDIVRHGENGFVYPVGSISDLADSLDQLVGDPSLRGRMAQRSREIISEWDFNADVSGILDALRSLRGSRAQNEASVARR